LQLKIFISGVTGELGFSLVEAFLNRGDRVRGIGRRDFDNERLNHKNRGRFKYHPCDTTNVEDVNKTFDALEKDGFLPEIIVFCAGEAISDVDGEFYHLKQYKKNFDINLYGALLWVEKFLPAFIERGKGTFAAISSMSVYRESRKNRIGYSASKIALNKTFKNLRQHYSSHKLKFVVFNMGRMAGKDGVIGITYQKAAKRICRELRSRNGRISFNIPFSQYILTQCVRFVPNNLFQRYLMKN
jgi:NAD(P)-dependent dehydrogenase (short-subunit alcohol dehydrogenase family)